MERAKFDWLAELCGASALGLAAGYAALKAAPSLSLPAPAAMTAGGFAFFGLGLAAMRSVMPEERDLRLPGLPAFPIEDGELLLTEAIDQPMLLENVYDEPLLLEDLAEDDALLLEDALPLAVPESRVVQLFASAPHPTPGQLKERIDLHLAGAPRLAPTQVTPPPPDASEALYAALNELKRSLR